MSEFIKYVAADLVAILILYLIIRAYMKVKDE